MDTKHTSLRARLVDHLREIDDLQSAASVLNWDQTTYMPPQGATARARQLATLQRLAHARAVDPQLSRLLDTIQASVDQLPVDHDDVALVRRARRIHTRATAVPAEYVADLAAHTAITYSVWADARPADDFATLRPYLEKTLSLSRRYADFFPGAAHIADPWIDEADEGLTVATIRPLFAELRSFLAPLAAAIAEQPLVDASCLHQHYPEDPQWRFGESVIRAYGYDFRRGRQDKTLHPFCTRFAWGDVRITTRIDEHNLATGLFGTLHEAGHALYEQGTAPEFDSLPLGQGTSSSVHESQSRLWENIVGRSHGLWRHYYPRLQATFPDQLGQVDLETFYRAINRVEPSLIRVEADEVTYNLHVIIRFELELALLEGRLRVPELPDAWRDYYGEYLGVRPDDDRDGVLQDVHWFAGPIGGQFQGYTLGNILSAQFYAKAVAAHPEIPEQIGHGQFAPLLEWLQTQIYRHGSKYLTQDLVARLTGGPITLAPYKEYLSRKFGALYSV